MGVSDLLWACPECGERGGVDAEGVCRRCGVAFQRGRGAMIRARMPDGRTLERTPAEWTDRLPDPAALLVGGEGEEPALDEADGLVRPPGPVRRARVVAREVTGTRAVRGGQGRFLNRVELFGSSTPGTLEMGLERLVYRPEGGEPRAWPFEALTAIQTSSRTLQVKARGQDLVSFRFTDDSVFLWENLLRAALRAFYRRTGRGEIVEFQPRIVAR